MIVVAFVAIELVIPAAIGAGVGFGLAGSPGAVLGGVGLTLLWWLCGWLAADDD